MDNKRLIRKYGEPILIDTIDTKAYFEESRKSYYFKKSVVYTSFDVEVIHTLEEILLDDVLVLKGEDFGVLETKPVFTSGKLSYVETVAYKDDFDKDILIKKQSINTTGCNLPNVSTDAPISAKARIKTVKPTEYLQYALQGAKVPTHIIVLKHIDGIGTSDSIEWGARGFEVLTIENINETDTLLAFNCIEVLQ
jgi:hypothetical protein